MSEYRLHMTPGKIVKETYTTTQTRVVNAEAPLIADVYRYPYGVNISFGIEDESIKIHAHDGQFVSEIKQYENKTKGQRLLTLGRVVSAIISEELKSIFKKNYDNPLMRYQSGLPDNFKDVIENAKSQYNDAFEEYTRNLSVPNSQNKIINRETITVKISPSIRAESRTETLDDKL